METKIQVAAQVLLEHEGITSASNRTGLSPKTLYKMAQGLDTATRPETKRRILEAYDSLMESQHPPHSMQDEDMVSEYNKRAAQSGLPLWEDADQDMRDAFKAYWVAAEAAATAFRITQIRKAWEQFRHTVSDETPMLAVKRDEH